MASACSFASCIKAFFSSSSFLSLWFSLYLSLPRKPIVSGSSCYWVSSNPAFWSGVAEGWSICSGCAKVVEARDCANDSCFYLSTSAAFSSARYWASSADLCNSWVILSFAAASRSSCSAAAFWSRMALRRSFAAYNDFFYRASLAMLVLSFTVYAAAIWSKSPLVKPLALLCTCKWLCAWVWLCCLCASL